MDTARRLRLLFALLATVSFAERAAAHRVRIFASVDGHVIRGHAYTPGGGRITVGSVEVWTTGAEPEEILSLDAQGGFAYAPKARCDHRLVLKIPDGHQAEFTVSAAELPDTLPAPAAVAANNLPGAGADASAANPQAGTPAGDRQPLAGEIRQLRRQVLLLREQLDEFQEQRRLQDVIGGAGYIFGASGLAFYIMARRRQASK